MAFTFNGVSSTTHLIENKVHHTILAPLTSRNLKVPGRAGVYDFGVSTGAREIVIDVTIKGTSQADLRTKVRTIASWLFQDDLKPMVFSDEPDKTYYARVAGSTDLEQIVAVGQGAITFICPDPFAEGASVTQTFASGAAITNNGTAKIFPIFTVNFTGAASSFKVMKGTQQVYVNKSFVIGDVLVIDHRKALVTVNGLRVMDKVDLSTVFFYLGPGGTVLAFAPTTNLTVQVDFKEKWL
ncbi:MAG: distal tail protein Dit [Desulfotomaculaceae bacterium]